MRRRLHAATVIVVALLAAMHAPAAVGQTGDTLVVGSQHTDFGTGEEPSPQTLENLTVEGSGDSASVVLQEGGVGAVDSFEDGDINDYAGDTSYYSTVTSPVADGSYALEASGASSGKTITRTDVTVSQGDSLTWRANLSSSSAASGLFIGVQSETGENSVSGYYLEHTASSDRLRIYRADDGSYTSLATTSVSIPTDEYLTGSISWSESGELVFELTDAQGNTIATVSATDTTYTSGGVGFRTSGGTTYFDAVEGDQSTPSSATYVSATHEVSNAESAAINITQLSNVSVDAQVRTDGGTTLGSDTITSTGNHTIALSDTSSESLETVLDVTVTGENPEFELADESILFNNSAPMVDNASATPSGGDVLQPPPTLSLDVSDPQFGTQQGEELTVEWYVDGEKRGETTTNSNGTVSYELDSIIGGDHTWHAVVTDSYGAQTTTQTFDFSAPSELRVYSESDPDQLIDGNVSLRVRFFASGSEEVIEREVTDGTVDLSGLPTDQRYIVTVRANETDQWTYRRIVIDSLIETNSIYLLNESEPHSQIIFELDDPTGQFPPEETTLYVEKPITKDYDGDNTTETRYQVIAGDIFGASGDFPVVLQEEARYRLRVETSDGSSSRILGYYSVSGPATELLQIQRVAPDPDADAGASFRAAIEEREGGDYIAIRYQDFSESTQEVQYEVVDANGTVVVPNTTRTADSFADLYPVPAEYGDDAEFTVNYQIVREGETRGGSIELGQLSAIADRFGLDPQILTILSYIAIIGTMGLVVINNTRVAPFAGTAVASGLVVVGTVAIPIVVLSVAGIVSILVLVGGGQ